ncbi:FG-GAP-like repeat-containing protein [Hymenobacter sp. ASUV-10]|uniref:FG-GAP-like repeat-containing protein n=1 Tax=Hymenobacter aranciens TaxID=3063996 RepID=A0ABT9B9Z4_9BACT|nr:FG-GAP-like repeat-containing protein [Hymenobacter sp. ASUV-10]MDO7873373.1 FG-GAP-like repeat-containing protein [Hymenobacter sp. ASUV-10]
MKPRPAAGLAGGGAFVRAVLGPAPANVGSGRAGAVSEKDLSASFGAHVYTRPVMMHTATLHWSTTGGRAAGLGRLLLGLALVLGALAARAQAPAWQQAFTLEQYSRNSSAEPRATATDANGDVLITGTFNQELKLGGTVLVSRGGSDVFLAKWRTATGTWAWATAAGGLHNEQVTGIALNGSSVYLTGMYFNTPADGLGVRFGTTPLPGHSPAVAPGSLYLSTSDLFLAKYTDQGSTSALGWVVGGGGTADDVGLGLAVQGSAVYVTGQVNNNQADANQVRIGGLPLPGKGAALNVNALLARYTDLGATARADWAVSEGGTGTDYGTGVAVQGTSVYMTGLYDNTTTNGNAVQFGAVVLNGINNDTNSHDAFVVAYTDAGAAPTCRWGQTGGGLRSLTPNAIVCQGPAVYIGGEFLNDAANSFQTRLGPLALPGERADATQSGFIAKCVDQGSAGSWSWARSVSSNNLDGVQALAVSGSQLYAAGFLSRNNPAGPALAFNGAALPGAPATALCALFVARYTDAGSAAAFDWVATGTAPGLVFALGVSVHGTRVYAPLATANTYAGQPDVTHTATLTGLGTFNRLALGELDATTGAWLRVAEHSPLPVGTSLVRATAPAPDGTLYVTGNFTDQVQFGSTLLTSAGGLDVFVAKYDPATATWLWAVRGGGTADDYGRGLAANANGVYVTGSFTNNSTNGSAVQFGGSALPGASTSTGLDMFLLSYTPAGTLAWARAGGGTADDYGRGLALLGGSVFVTGLYTNTATNGNAVQFGGSALPGSGTSPNTDGFLLKYSEAGSFTSATSFGGTGPDLGYAIATGNGAIYLTGTVTNNSADGNAVRVSGITTSGGASSTTSADVLVLKYRNTTGAPGINVIIVQGGSGTDDGLAISVVGTRVYVGGSFTNDAANGSGVRFAGVALPGMGSSSTTDAFLVKYLDEGLGMRYQWATAAGGSGPDLAYSVAATGTTAYLAGYATNTAADANAVRAAGSPLPGHGSTPNADAFVAAYTDNGTTVTPRWAKAAGADYADQALALTVAGSRLYAAGSLLTPAAFDAISLPSPNLRTVGFLAAVQAGPALTALSPASGPVGTTLTLTGTTLTGATSITFGGASANVVSTGFTVSADGTQITGVVVPAGATTGPVTVTTPDGTSNEVTFTVTPPLAISSVSPTANTRNAPRTSPVQVTFNQALTPGSTAALKVFGGQRGGLRSTASGSTTASGATLGFAPGYAFGPGETVAVSITPAATAAAGGSLARGRVLRFTAAAGVGPGVFGGGSEVSLAGRPTNLTVADIDNDGDLDLLTPDNNTSSVSVRLNNGAGGFSGTTTLPMASQPYALTTADVDGDGDPDLLVGNVAGGSVSVRFNDGAGNFTGTTNVPMPGGPGSLAVGDLDADGDLDLVATNMSANTVNVRFNDGAGNFTGTTQVPVGTLPVTVITADIDGDGDLDILTNNNDLGTVSVRLNNGAGVFSGTTDLPLNSYSFGLVAADLDGDGDLDLLTGSGVVGNTVQVHLNNGAGTFASPTSVVTDFRTQGIVAADVDGDGDLDLLTANTQNSSTVSVRLNNGAASFSGTLNVPTGDNTLAVAAADVDGDGDLDILAANTFSSSVSVRFNQSSPTISGFTPASGPVGTTVTVTGTALTGATALTLNGVAVSGFTVVDAATIQFSVPAGGTSGPIAVTTPGGTATSATSFTVLRDLVVSTGTPAAPVSIAADTYRNVTITGTGAAVLAADANVAGAFEVQAGGFLSTNCQAVTGPGSFALAAGATLAICDANGLRATGNSGPVRVAGTRSFSTGANYVYNGTAAQETGSGLPATVRSLTTVNNSTVTLSLPVNISQTLTIGAAGNLNLGGLALTLLSDATGTALVVNGGAGVVTGGTATVQRYLTPTNPGLGYRHYASPVRGNTLADLQTSTFAPVFNPAYNTSATPNLVTPFPTVFGYDQARVAGPASTYSGFDKGWYSPATSPGTPAAVVVGQGYAVNLAGTEKVDFTGTLNTGTYAVSLARTTGPTAAGGWALVGNPYPAPIDWTRIAASDRAGLDAAMYVFESSSQYGGAYRAYVNGVGSGSPLIATAQGFWVQVSSGQTAGTLTFRDAHRLTDYATQVPMRRGAADTRPQLQLTLTGAGLTDAVYLYAEAGATAAVDASFDAVKMPNPHGLNVATLPATGAALAIDGRAELSAATTIPLQVGVPAAGRYTFTAAALQHLAPGATLVLADALTNTRTVLAPGASYAFATTATTLPGRFFLNLVSAGALGTAPAGAALAAQVLLYPNPAHGTATLQVPAGLRTGPAALLNSLGQTVRTLPLAGPSTTVDLRGLAAGVYTLRLPAATGTIARRLVVE